MKKKSYATKHPYLLIKKVHEFAKRAVDTVGLYLLVQWNQFLRLEEAKINTQIKEKHKISDKIRVLLGAHPEKWFYIVLPFLFPALYV